MGYLIYWSDGRKACFDGEFVSIVKRGTLWVAVNTTHPLHTWVQPAHHFSVSVTSPTSSLPAKTALTVLPGFEAAAVAGQFLILGSSWITEMTIRETGP